jgi:hypothetical protein
MDTMSDLLFAISGAEIRYELSYPLDKAPRNMTKPDWLHDEAGKTLEGGSQIIGPPPPCGRSGGQVIG